MRFGAMRRQALAQALCSADRPADVAVRAFFRAHPALGRRDRARIAESVFDVLRQRRLYERIAFGAGGEPMRMPPEQAALDALLEVADARLAGRLDVPRGLPFEVRYSLPDWLAQALLAQFGPAQAQALGAALLEPAPLDLRANVLKADRTAVRRELDEAGIETQVLPHSGNALRASGKPALERSAGYLAGRFEVQDVGSQLLAMLAAPRRGQTVIDLCAGAGGKTLAMAAAMRSTGHVYACDVSAKRLQRMRQRLARSGADNVFPIVIAGERDARLERLRGRGDVVLVDAPCTGTGTLRRAPDLKWRIGPFERDGFVAQQRALLDAAAALVRPGGRLVYATCSLLAAENDEQRDAFESRHPRWTRCDPRVVLEAQGATLHPQATADDTLRLLPQRDDCDGFFAVRWRRTDEG
ncbi:MAG: RsmB/NOP family class I SAM-dependent RNA methyltransferase [Burkholderiaceae bacterium]|nr:RsmB/NOP family class I SAM-dependent RNA methyltransferase [Burkholderiaceae bacterium]